MKKLHIIVSKLAGMLGMVVFLIVLLASFDFSSPFSIEEIVPYLVRAAISAAIFWIAAMVVGDVVLKGVINDVDLAELNPLEGGLEQRLHERNKVKKVKIIERDIEISQKNKRLN